MTDAQFRSHILQHAFYTVHPLNGFWNEAKTYRGLLRKFSAEAAAGGLGGGRDHYAFGRQLPADSATSFNMWERNIQGIPNVFQALGSLAQWKVGRGKISGLMQYHWSLNYFHYHFQEEFFPCLKLLHIQLILKICTERRYILQIFTGKNWINKASHKIKKTCLKTTGSQIKQWNIL